MPKLPTYQTFCGVKLLNTRHPAIRQLKQSVYPTIHGTKVWGSGLLLMDFIKKNTSFHNTKLLEIGCGWGHVGIFAHKKVGCEVLCSDADEDVFPFLEAQAKVNKVKIKTIQAKFNSFKADTLNKIETIVGSDICFWDELNPQLFRLIKRAQKNGVKNIAIADPGRSPFRELCKQIKTAWPKSTKVIDVSIIRPVKRTGEILFISF